MKAETRSPFLFSLLGVVFLLCAWDWMQDYRDRGAITIYQQGRPVTEYTGPLAIVVICVMFVFGSSMLAFGIRGWLAKRKAHTQPDGYPDADSVRHD